MTPTQLALVILIALLLDLIVGDPKGRLHPVVWIGSLIGVVSGLAASRSKSSQFIVGAVALLSSIIVSYGITFGIVQILEGLPVALRLLVLGYLLKLAIAPAGLIKAGHKVAIDLSRSRLAEARTELRSLVSRPTDKMSDSEVSAAGIESVSENITDAVVAPLFYFVLFGLPGAWAYRAVNTADAMIGYRGEHEWTGKVAARVDDAANLIPARAAAVALCVSTALLGKDIRAAVRTLFRDRGATDSPNAGWTMAPTAGALGIRLEKSGQYVLGSENRPPTHRDLSASLPLAGLTMALAALMLAAVPYVLGTPLIVSL